MAMDSVLKAVASVAGELFGKKKTGGETIPMIPDWQKALQGQLGGWASQFLPKYTPGEAYGGRLTAGATPYELSGLDTLNNFLTDPGTGELFAGAKNQILDTLGGKYMNPKTNPWIAAMTNLSNRNLQDSVDASRRSAGSRGSYFTKSAIQEEGRIREGALANLDAIIGQALQAERGRQFSAVPIAQTLDQYEKQNVPLSKIGASQNFGALPRILEQADLEAQYNDFIRQRGEMSGAVNTAQSMATMQPYPRELTAPAGIQNNTLGNILSIISKLNFNALQGGGNIWDKLGGLLTPQG